MNIEFIPINDTNRKEAISLHVAQNQLNTIETIEKCLTEADELALWRPLIISIDSVNVGFAMYGLWTNEGERGRVWLDRFLIDESHQGNGYSTLVLPVLIKKITEEYSFDTIYLSVYDDNKVAIRLYQKLGFEFNGEHDLNGEAVMCLHV